MSETESALGQETGAAVQEEELAKAKRLAQELGFAFVDLAAFRENLSVWQQIPMDSILRYRIVPLREEDGSVVVAVAEPERYRELDELELTLGRPLEIEVAAAFQIEAILALNRSSSFLLVKASEELNL